MPVRIMLLDDMKEPVEVARLLRLHQVVLIRHGPPDVPVRRHPRQYIPRIAVILLRRHRLISPAIVRMKQNQICLDIQRPQITNPLLQMREEELRIEPREIVLPPGRARRRALMRKRIERRLVVVVLIVLRKDEHPNLRERRALQRRQRLLLQCLALVHPRLRGVPNGKYGVPSA